MKKILLGLTAVFALSVAVPAVAVAGKKKPPAEKKDDAAKDDAAKKDDAEKKDDAKKDEKKG